MELVDGRPLGQYVRAAELSHAGRIALFTEICEAVQHAHQKGVLHRDLKASNVLVCPGEGGARPVLIDFGLACARDPQARAAGETDSFSGSLSNMTPEQARGDAHAIDTRTDVYGLGCLLYELLCDAPPFDAEQYSGRELRAVCAEIAERELPLEDERLGSGEAAWIVRRAMAHEPSERYASALELARDLRRLLSGGRVQAVPSHMGYSVRVALRRNRAAFAIAATLVFGLLLAISGLSRGKREAEARRSEAEQATALQADLRAATELEAGRTKAMHDFVLSTLALANLNLAPSPQLTVRDLLLGASARLTHVFDEQPTEEIELRMALGRALYSVGELEVAAREATRALELIEAGGENHRGHEFDALFLIARIHASSANEEGIEYAYRAQWLAIHELRARDAELGTLVKSAIQNTWNQPREETAENIEQVLDRANELFSPDDKSWEYLADLLELAGSFYALSSIEESGMLLLEESVRLRTRLSDPLAVARARRTWIEVCLRRGDAARARGAIEANIELMRASLPSEHWLLWDARSQLAAALSTLGDETDQTAELDAAFEALVLARGDTSLRAIEASARRLANLRRNGQVELARLAADELAYSLARARNAPEEWKLQELTLDPGSNLHGAMDDLRRHSEDEVWLPNMQEEYLRRFEELAQRVIELCNSELAPDDPRQVLIARQFAIWGFYLVPLQDTGGTLLNTLCGHALLVLEQHEDSLPAAVANAQTGLAWSLQLRGEFERAEELSRRATALYESCKPSGSLPTITARSVHADALASLGDRSGALEELRQTLLEAQRFLPGENSCENLQLQIDSIESLREP